MLVDKQTYFKSEHIKEKFYQDNNLSQMFLIFIFFSSF